MIYQQKKEVFYFLGSVKSKRRCRGLSLEKMFLHEKTVDIMLKILEAEEKGKEAYPLGISKEVGSPYSYISKVLSEFEENALIESEFRGRVRKVKFTKEGRRIAELFKQIKEELSKDFVARKKVNMLEEVVEKANGKDEGEMFKILAPVITELKILKNQTTDEGTAEMIEKLESKIDEILKVRQ
jgi:predicted transcriptional regulator